MDLLDRALVVATPGLLFLVLSRGGGTRPTINGNAKVCRARGRPVEVQTNAERIIIRQDGVIVGEHERRFVLGRSQGADWSRAG